MDELGNLSELSLRLHSRYQPRVEADRYIGSLDIGPDIDCFILIEPGLGYLIQPLQKYYPEAKIAVLHADSRFREAEQVQGIPYWYPDSGTGVQEFLENEIPDTALIRLIEWRPSVQVYGELCLQLVRESSVFIKRVNAGRRTAAAFGKRWVKNFFRNISLIQKPVLYHRTEIPVVITGAGPSLETSLPMIRAAGDGAFIIAASSSLPALQAGGVCPDMVIGTDGGGWALTHLYSFFRSQKYDKLSMLARPALLALSLCAAVPSQCSSIPVLLINDGSLWQNIALNAVGLPSITIPQRGTVTASAFDLAMIMTSGSIYLAGMDLSVSDIKSHARPNGFDFLFSGTATRMRPVYSQLFTRSRDISSGGSLDIYAAWFKSRIASWPDRIFSLGGNHGIFTDNLPEKPQIETGGRYNKDFFKVVSSNGSCPGRVKQAADSLKTALHDPQFSAALTGELVPLLFSSDGATAEDKTSAGMVPEIKKVIEEIALRYDGKGHGQGYSF